MVRGAAIAAVLLVLISPVSRADSRLTEHAEWTIRRLITNSTKGARVSFKDTKEEFLSFAEARVVGEGVVSARDGWDTQPFRYSIKVNRKDLRTRDARVEFADGRMLTTSSGWAGPVQPDSDAVRFTAPGWHETVRSRDVTFRGASLGPGRVNVTVFDRRDREAARQTTTPDRRGNWSLTIRLPDGTYRAVATSGRWSDGDEVRFRVERGSGNWDDGGFGWGGSGGTGNTHYRITIDSPRNGETIRDGYVQSYGTATSRQVDVRIYRGSKIAHRSYERVSGGRWSVGTALVPGGYRMVVEAVGGRGSREVRFQVR